MAGMPSIALTWAFWFFYLTIEKYIESTSAFFIWKLSRRLKRELFSRIWICVLSGIVFFGVVLCSLSLWGMVSTGHENMQNMIIAWFSGKVAWQHENGMIFYNFWRFFKNSMIFDNFPENKLIMIFCLKLMIPISVLEGSENHLESSMKIAWFFIFYNW